MGLVTIATLIGTFSSFFGLGTRDNPLPWGYAMGLIAFILAIVVCVVYVLLPIRKTWAFGPDPKAILESTERDAGRLLWSQALGMQRSIEENEVDIRKRGFVYSLAVITLGCEAAFAVAASLASR